MSYGIMRAAKVKGGADVAGMEMHNLRKKESRSNPDIDRGRSDRNYSIGSYDGNMSFNARIEQQIRERYKGSRAIRKDANKCVELLFTSDRDFMDSLNPEQERAFFKDCYDFTARHFGGQENIIADVVHKDEIGAAHMHIDFVPLTADGRLSAKDYLGGKKELQELQDSFFEEVAKKWGLERGSRANLDAGERGRKHLTPQELKAQTEAEIKAMQQEKRKMAAQIKQAKAEAAEQQKELQRTKKKVDAANQELKLILDEKAQASVIKGSGFMAALKGEETVTFHKNMLERTQAIGTEAWQHHADAVKVLEKIIDEKDALKDMKKKIEPLHQEAAAARNEAVRLQKAQERLIEERSDKLTASLFERYKKQIMGYLEQHHPQAAQGLNEFLAHQNRSRKQKHSL
ncbi:MAG: plasmid recombination protein [Lachnospiraceae bacterium]|nr:plasmid recombination protein [Lachnospiraceae bacterium]MCM1234654.1 plasmid recombination protein [Ruminococcus flavefaciens]